MERRHKLYEAFNTAVGLRLKNTGQQRDTLLVNSDKTRNGFWKINVEVRPAATGLITLTANPAWSCAVPGCCRAWTCRSYYVYLKPSVKE
jgi:hypothetical protein